MIRIDLNEFNYNLPPGKIAQYPLSERDSSRILLYKNKTISEDIFRNIYNHLPSDSLLLFNNTMVIKARFLFRKRTGASIEVLCLEPLLPSEYTYAFTSKKPVEWKCIIGNLKKWKTGIISMGVKKNNKNINLFAERLNSEGDAWRIRFSWDYPDMTFGEVIEIAGHVPLPPYINRPDEKEDNRRYQTIYSKIKGSVAAPTAGLHFTKDVLNKLSKKGIKTADLTLHVGAGTFQPVKSDNILKHEMHTEHFIVSTQTVENIIKNIGKIIPVGTTSVRTLESLYCLGLKLMNNPLMKPDELFLGQWEAYEMDYEVNPCKSLDMLLLWMKRNSIIHLESSTRIIILPGYNFKMTDGMITNFHQPKSTLLLLIAAWIGDDWKKIYNYALENDFRFLSYGDGSLLLK